MKLFSRVLLLACLFVSIPALAKGRLMLEPFRDLTTKTDGLKAGLAVYERLIGPIAFNSYTGVGLTPIDRAETQLHTDWLLTKNGLVFAPVSWFSLEPGIALGKAKDDSFNWQSINKQVYLKMSVQLW